jgi:phosphomethylpyrimidine synthase
VKPTRRCACTDASGARTDPDVQIDIARGLAPLRGAWINERQDQPARHQHAYGRGRLNDPARVLRMAHMRPCRAAPRPV